MQQSSDQDRGVVQPGQDSVAQSGESSAPAGGTDSNQRQSRAELQTAPGGVPSAETGAAPNPNAWVTFSSVKGLPIVDLTTGAHVGDVADLILSGDFRYVDAFTASGGAFRRDKSFPARGATIGLHAVTLPRGAMESWDVRGLDEHPRANDLLGMKLLTEAGRIAGKIQEIRLDPNSGAVVGYEVIPPEHGMLARLRHREAHVFPASAVTQYGRDAVIVQEAAARQYLSDGD